jgi:hypothetical protein
LNNAFVDAMSTASDNPALNPDQLDHLLANLEQELTKLSPDNPSSQEMMLEIETLRAMLESSSANHEWSGEQRQFIQKLFQRITR